MFFNLAGEEQFRRGLNEYLTTYAYSNAAGKDLWVILGKYISNLGGNELTDVAKAWTTQTGYPVIKV